MVFKVSNDRSVRRQVSPIVDHADGAFLMWLRQQQRSFESWERELLGCVANEDTLTALQIHKTWLSTIIEASE